MSVSIAYNPLLVLLSIAVAIQASYVGLHLTIQVAQAQGVRQRVLLVGASLSLAMGIWAMHFVGMLAATLPLDASYEVLPTLISFLICVLVVGFAIAGASLWPKTAVTLASTATVMGTGIATMHYVGMMALHESLHMVHDPIFVAVSFAAAVSASAAALWLATMARRRPSLIVCALVLGLAISSMHYIAMAGTTIHRTAFADVIVSVPSLSPGLMAIVVAIVAFFVSAGFFLALVPEARQLNSVPSVSDSRAISPVAPGCSDRAEIVSPTSARPSAARASAEASRSEPASMPIPVERDGARILLAPSDIYAVRANAHYCAVVTGREELFCSLSISDVETKLGGGPFVRVHRSHIVNLDRVAAVRKTADGGFADLTGPKRLSVPISRTKINAIRDHLAERASAR